MDHLSKFRPDDLWVARSQEWIVTVRQKQIVPGSLVVLPLREIPTLSEVHADEAADLMRILGRVEQVAYRNLGAARVNLLAAMMKDPFVHFHFFPRFQSQVRLFDQVWVDDDWPRAIQVRDVETSTRTLSRVADFYRQALHD